MAKTLYRVAWLPQETVEKHFKEGNQVVLKGATSTTTSTKVASYFYNLGVTNPDPSIKKQCLLLEFDALACKEAVDIRFLSDFPQEEEWLLPPFFRALVQSIEKVESIFEQRVYPDFPVLRVRVRGLRRLPPLSGLMKWEMGLSIGQLLGLTITLAAHSLAARSRDGLGDALRVSEALAILTTEADQEEHKKKGRKVKLHFKIGAGVTAAGIVGSLGCAVAGLVATVATGGAAGAGLALWALGVWGTATIQHGMNGVLTTFQERRLAKSRSGKLSRLQASTEYWAAKVSKLAPVLQQKWEEVPAEVLSQLGANFEALQREVAEGGSQEDTLLERLFAMLMEAEVIGKILEVGTFSDQAPLSIQLPEDVVEKFRPEGWAKATWHPVVHSICAADQVFKLMRAPAPTNTEDAPDAWQQVRSDLHLPHMCLFACLDQLRLRLSRTRIVMPIGLPDAGKTTVLKHAFRLEGLSAGLQEEGRTKSLSFSPCPACELDSSEVLIGDVPGFGDAIEERNAVVRVMLGFLNEQLRDMMLVLLVQRSGRDVTTPLDELAGEIAKVGAHLFVIFTHADERFNNISKEAKKYGTKQRDPEWLKKCAEKIKTEDEEWKKRHFPENPPRSFYACFEGQLALRDECGEEEDEEEEGYQAADWLIKGFHENFKDVLVRPSQLREVVLEHFGFVSGGEVR